MSEFQLYLTLGLEHITDVKGYDHILFVIALCAVYAARDWKRLLILITAFTIGHSITLALSTFRVISYSTQLIEFLIPTTIFLTALLNIINRDRPPSGKVNYNYFMATFFGLIHGLGFSNYLRSLLGSDETIIVQLLAFNLGLEVGQIIIVIIFMVISFFITLLFRINKRDWNLIISAAVLGMSIALMVEAKYW